MSFLTFGDSQFVENPEQKCKFLKQKVFSGFYANGLASKAKDDRSGSASERIELNETAESGVDKVISSCEKNPSVHKAYTNFLRQRKTALDAPLHAVSSGRSMIEMLGVLAIIGVLSVGGIAGYGKAMRMWNSNIQKSQITQILHSLIHLRYELRDNQANSNSITPILNALGEIPAGMKYANGILSDKTGNYYSGNFGKTCWQESQDSDKKVCQSQMYLYVRLTKTESSLVPSSADLCENLVYVAKENSQDVINVTTFLGNSQDDDNPGWRGYHQSEVFNRNTLKTATPLQIKNMCRTCTNHGYCAVAIYLKTS